MPQARKQKNERKTVIRAGKVAKKNEFVDNFQGFRVFSTSSAPFDAPTRHSNDVSQRSASDVIRFTRNKYVESRQKGRKRGFGHVLWVFRHFRPLLLNSTLRTCLLEVPLSTTHRAQQKFRKKKTSKGPRSIDLSSESPSRAFFLGHTRKSPAALSLSLPL